MPRTPVNQLRFDMPVRKQTFLLRDKIVSTTRVGNSMLRVTLADRTGTIAGGALRPERACWSSSC